MPVLKHALDLLSDSKEDVKKDHVKIQANLLYNVTCARGHHHHHQHHQDHEEGNETKSKFNKHLHIFTFKHTSLLNFKGKVTNQEILERPRQSPYPMLSRLYLFFKFSF
jgi:hypothetical protein